MTDKHEPAPMVDEISEFEVLEIAVRELAIEKGLFTADDHRAWTEYIHTLSPLPAARLVAKAWLDPEFKKLAVRDGISASLEIGADWINGMPTRFGTPSDYCNLRVLEDTPTLKHVVVCTLCSCYPRPILGQSPEWYRTPKLSSAHCSLAATGARRVWSPAPARGGRKSGRLQSEIAVHCYAGASGGN